MFSLNPSPSSTSSGTTATRARLRHRCSSPHPDAKAFVGASRGGRNPSRVSPMRCRVSIRPQELVRAPSLLPRFTRSLCHEPSTGDFPANKSAAVSSSAWLFRCWKSRPRRAFPGERRRAAAAGRGSPPVAAARATASSHSRPIKSEQLRSSQTGIYRSSMLLLHENPCIFCILLHSPPQFKNPSN